MRPPMSMVNTKRRRGSAKNTIIPRGPSRSRGPTPPAPCAADEGGGGAELEEGGRELEQERDAGEGVCCVRRAWAGWDDDVVGSWWKRDRVEERNEKEGRTASYCLSLGG